MILKSIASLFWRVMLRISIPFADIDEEEEMFSSCRGCNAFKRCAECALEHAYKQMANKGWEPIDYRFEADLKKLGIEFIEWMVKVEKGLPVNGLWAAGWAAKIAQANCSWEIRSFFLARLKTDVEFRQLLEATFSLGGADAVGHLLKEKAAEIGVYSMRSMARKEQLK